jgi:hypothetical protein
MVIVRSKNRRLECLKNPGLLGQAPNTTFDLSGTTISKAVGRNWTVLGTHDPGPPLKQELQGLCAKL